MTSTNDGRDVKSNQTSGQKGKKFYLELYNSLEARLSGDSELRQRAEHLCEAWRRIHSICRHASPPSHPHLISWLERHTAKTVLQTDWQRATSKDEHAIFEQAITSVIEEIDLAVADRHGVELPWESQLRKRSEWHKGVLSNPWGHPVLKLLLDSRAQPPSNEQILEWLKEERDAVFTVRLRELVASKCDDLALGITAAIMNRVRAAKEPLSDVDQMDDVAENLQSEDNTEPTFESILRSDAGFSDEVWAFLTDLEFVLLHKGDGRSRCIELAKQTPLRNGNEIIERLQKRLLNARSPRDKKLWKNANDVATLIAQVVIARCMVVPSCSGAVRAALYWCTRALTALLAPAPLRRAAAALAAPAATAQHLYTLARAASRQKNTDEMKPFICELYVRAITSGMNELERLKFDVEKEKEARAAEQTLASWFMELGSLFGASARFRCECTLTAFSVHPSPDMYERIHAAPLLTRVALDVVEPTQADTNSEYGSWATDSRSKTNFVKTSETLNLKQSQHQTNVLSTAIVTEGEALGLGVELCQDIVVLLSGPRVKTLSWDMDRELLLENCRTYMERTHGGTRALTTELKYLNLDPSDYQHLPEEEDDENDLYYGIEKGYEHLVEFQEAQPEAIWDDAIWDSEFTDSASSNDESESISWRKKIKHTYSEEDSDPLSLVAEAKKEKKKERPHSKERKEHKRKPKKERPQNKEKKERKKKEKPQNPSENNVTSLSNLVGMKVSRIQVKEDEETGVGNTNLSNASVTHCDSQGKSSLTSDPYILYPHNTVGNTEVARNKTMLTQIQKDKNISHASTTEQSTVSNVNSSNATIERLNVNEDVKKRIAKLIQFRRQKSSMSSDSNCSLSSPIPQNIQSERSATPNVETNTMRTEPTSSVMNQTVHTDKFHTIPKSDCVTALKQESMSALVGSRIVKESKVSMTKKQTEQLNILKNEANSFLSVSNASQFDNKNSTTQAPDWVSETCSRVREIKYHYINKTKPSLPSQQSSITPIQESQQRPVTPRTYNENSHSKSSYNNQNTLESSSFDAHQKSFQQFLKELQGTINPDVNAPKTVNKSVTCSSKKELKPKSKATPVMATLPKTDITHSPLCAKPVTQQKKAENALNTFSRLSYMHKNKLGETKSKQYAELDTYSQIMLQNSISAELDQRIAELRLSKMKTLQATSDLIISRVSNTAKSEQNARVQVQKIEMQPNRGGTSACTGKPEHFARVEVQRNEMQSSRVGNSAYTAKPEQIARVEVQKNEMQSSRLSNSAYIAKPEQNVRLEVEKLEMHSNRVGPSAKLDHNARMEVQKIESSKLTANRHSVLSSILQVKPTSTLKSPLPKNENTKTFELNRLRTDMKSTPSSSLSERDQQDLILLLRQQSKLNAPLSQARTETNTNKIINHLQLSNTSIKINSPTNRSIPVQSPHASITDMTVNMQNKTPVNANSVTNKILPAQVNTLNKTLVHANNLTSKIIPAQLSHVPVTEKTLKTQKTSININSLNNVQSPLIAVTEKTINTQNVKNVLNNSLHSAVTEKSLHTQFSNIIHNEERNKTSEMTCTKSIRTSEFARNKGGGKTKSKSRKPKTSTTSSSTGIAKVLKIARKKSGTKPRNEGTSKAVVKQDWTKVLDAIRAQKTPSRGPNALDFALKKDSYENFVNERFRTQRIANNRNTEGEFNKATCSNQYGAGNAMISPEKLLSADVLKQSQAKGSPNTNQHESINTPFFTKASAEKDFNLKKDTYDNFASDRLRTQRISKNRNTEGKSLTKTTCPNQHDVGYAKMTTEKLLSTDVPKQNQVEPIKTPNQIGTPEKIEAASSKKFTCGINREADPFISGIPNSDYDLLEELMDDDLRQEIGELSDEERFDAAEALTMKPKASCSTDGGNIAPNKPIAIIPTKLVNDQSKASAINLRSSARVATKKITQEPISQVNFPYVSMSVKSSEDTISKINIPNASTPIKSSVGTTLTKQQFGVTVIKANPHLMCNKQYPIPTKTTLSAQTDSPVNIPVTAAGEIFVNKPYIVSGMPTTWKSQNKMIKTNKAKRNCTSAPSSSSPQIDKPKNNVRSSRNQVKPTCNFNNNITGVTINQSTNNQVRHNNITIDAPILIDVAPQPSLQNMIILNEIVYNPCNTTLQTQETQGHTDSCNVGSHTIVTVDRIANVPILPSTHCAPVIIDAPVTLPVPINDVSIPSVTVPLNITQTTICTQPNLFASTETVLVSSNQMNEIPNSGLVKCSDPDTIRNDIHKIEKISKAKPNNLPVDVGSKSDNIIPDTTIKNSDRKVLSQVQEKQKLSDKFDLKTRLTDDEVKIAHAEGDRLKMKRLAIINRKTNHYIINPPIPLTYAPLAVDKNLNTERRLSHRNKHMKSGLTASELNPANFSKDNLANFETTGKSMERKCCEETEASVQINENFKENKDDVISGNRMLLKPSNTSTNIDVGSVICSKAKGRTKRARLKPTLKRVTKRNRKKNNAEVNIEKYSKSAKNSVNVVNLQNTVDRQENTSNVVMIDNNITTKGVSVVSVRTSKRIRDRKNQKIKVIEEPLISGIVQENNVSSTHNNKITHEVPDNIFDIEEELIKSKINEVKASSITTTSNTSKVRPLLQKTKKTLPQTPNTSSLQRAQKIVSLPEAPKITAMLQQKSRTLPEVPNSALLLKDQKACTLLELPNTPSLDSQKTALLSEGTLGPNIPTEQTVTENEKSVAYDPVKVLSKNAEKGIFLEETIASKKVKALQEDNAVNRDETLHSVLSNIQNKTGNVCSEEITCVPEKICSLSSEPMVKGTPVHVVVETDGYKSVIVKDTDKTDKEPNALDNIILESENGNINEIKSVITFNQDNKNKTTGSIDQPLEVISNENQQSINEDVHEEVDLLSDPNKPQNEEKVDHVGSVLTRKLKDESISITVADDTHCDETIKININSSLVGTVNITNNDVACDTNKVIKRHRKQSKLTRLNKTACRKVEELKKVQHDLNVSSLNSDPERIYRLDRNSGIVEKNIEKNVSHKNQNSELNPDNDDIPLSYKNSISIEELPAEDPHDCTKKSVRIRLPSGKVFKATVFGGVPVSFDSLFKDPALKNILLSGFNDTQRYTLSIQQFSTPSNVIVDTRIKAINIHPKNVHKSSNSLPADVETVNLISDDEEDNVPQKFSTEFGSFAIKSIDNSVLFVDHQNKFSQKCSVKLIRCDSFVNIIANSNTQYYPESGQIDSVINKGDETNSLQNLRDDILFTNSSELSPTDDAINLNSLTIAAFVPEVIEIDDSSNDCAAFNVNVQDDFTNAQSSAKIVELKNQLLRDLGVTQFIEQTTHENDKEKPYANPEYLENPDYSKVITKKCSIKLIRCDKMWEKMKSNEVIIYNTETDNNLSKVSGDIDENVVSEIGLSPTGSFAILNGLGVFEDVIDPVIDTDDRSSPIIDIFQTVAALNDTETDDSIMNRIIDIRPQPEYSMKIIGHFICDSDWFATKSCLRDQSIMSNISIFQLTSTLTGNHLDISTDYDSDNDHIYSSLNLSTKNIQQQCNNLGVLSLRKIMLEYFVDTSNINRLQTTSNVTSSIVPPHKRKMLVDTNNDVANKISKIDFAMALENDNKDTNCAEPVSNRTTDALPKNIEDEDMLFKLQDQLYCESDTIPGSYNCIPMNSKTNSHPEQNQAITKNAKFETKSIEMPAYSLKSLVSRFIVSNLFSVIRYQYKIENNDISSKTGSNDTNFDTEEKSQNKYAKKLLNTSIRITCDSEWYMTKRTLHGLSININIQTASGICQIIENVLSHNKVLETGKTEICLLPIQKNFVEGETTVNNDARDIETENNSINNVCPADDYLMTRLEELADEHTNEITVTVRTIENTSESTKNVSCPTPDSHKILINIHHNPEEKFMENDTVLDNQLAGLTESSEMPSICKIPEISETNDFDKITDSSKGDMVVKEITQFCASECGSKSNNETNNSRETSIGSVHGSKKTLFYDVVEDNHGSNDLKKTERSNFKILQDDFTESKSIPSLIITDFNETPLNPQTNEIIRALYPPEKNENIVLNLSERDQLTFTDGSIIEIENEAMPPVMQKEDKVDMTPVKIKNIDTIQNFTARACNLLNNKKIQVLVVNDVIKASDVIETHDIEELVVEHDNVAIEIVKESAIGNEVPKEIKRNLLIDENKYICETEILAEEITQDEILNNNSVNQEDHSVVDTSSSHVDKESTHVNFGLIESNVDKSEEQETRNTTVETIVSNESFQVLKETHSLVLEKTIDEVSNENVLEKNVTLVYKDDSGVILKGIEYEDPINGTCYVFPLTKSVNINSSRDVFNDGTEDVIQVIQEIDDNEIFDNLPIDDTIQGCNIFADEDLQVTIPKKTYSKSHVKRKLGDTDIGVRKLRRASKYKDIVDARVNEKRYKRGRNIDTTKLSVTAVSDLYYGKEYKRLIEYCSTVKFSYSISFHKEFIDVSALVNDWPINGSCDIEKFDDSLSDSPLFTDTENNPKPLYDPMLYTLAEELDSEFTETEFTSSSMDETNFNMGFGEGSGRVIQNLDKGGDKSKFSAATLSDVKQTQPLLLSEECDCMKDHNKLDSSTKDQIQKVKQYITYIQLHDKIRSFFKKTQEELTQDWIKEVKKDNVNNNDNPGAFPFDYYTTNYIEPAPIEAVVQVVQVGQLPVNAAAQNPVTCDPRVTQVSDASPSQCSVENSPRDDSQPEVKTEYTELTTADLSLPLVQKYEHHDQTNNMNSHDPTNIITGDDIPIETELIKSEVKIELIEDATEGEENSKSNDNDLQTMTNNHIYNNNVEYLYETNNTHTSLDSESNVNTVFSSSEKQNTPETFVQQNGSSESSDQIANAMNAAGITAESEAVVSPRAHALVNISQKIRQNSVNTPQSSANVYSKTTTINAMALQQALAQILPPPLNQTNANESNQQGTNSSGNAQVLHIVQSKNASGNQITLVDNSPQSVISTANTTPVLHIVQNKGGTVGSTSNGTPVTQQNAFSGLSLVDAGLQQGGNQLLHIVNTGNQKTTAAGQLLKRVNLLTNLTNVQGNNEQKMVQFVCKSADGKAIQLNAPHQRSMVLRLQPIESTNVQTPPPPKPSETQEPSNSTNIASSKESVASQQEIKSRSVYEENYAKFIQNSSSKPSSLEKSTSLPKFNQAFGKPVFQEGNQKQNEINSNNSHLPPGNSNTENTECQSSENTINLEHIGQISSPPLLLRKSPAQTTTSQHQANLVQQIKQSITPMNIQTMHGGVIYTRQIPVNIGGGQTINLITVPSTELIDDSGQKQSDVKFVNQGDVEPSIIKIVPQNQSGPSAEVSQDDIGGNVSNDNTQNHQQPVLTQMRIKLPMLSKTPQMVSGARVVRPSFFQIQRNVIGGTNQPVYQQLVLTAAPPLGQQTLRLPQAQTTRQIKVSTENASSETQMSTSTLEQLREFDMVLEQVKERSTVQPHSKSSSSFKSRSSSNDTTDSAKIVTSAPTETTQQVLYSITSNPALNVAYVNRKATVTTPTTSTYVRSPDSSGMVDSPTSSTHVQLPHTVTTESSSNEAPAQPKAAKAKSKSRSKPPQPANSVKIHTVPPKSSQKPIEDEQTTQRILYILAEYKEQVENSPDKDKPAPRRRTNPPTNPSGSSKRKRSGCRRSGTRDMSPVHGEDTRTMGSEDSSCGTSQGDCSENCLESHSPQDSPRKVVRKLTFEQDPTINQTRLQPQRNLIVADGQTITVARGTSGKPTTAVLMPANYILPVSMVKGGQQIAIVTNRGPKLLTVTGGEGGATNALLLQRLIGPAGLKPVLTRPGVRHVRLPTAALHNLQAFNLATTTTIQPPDSTASPAPAPTPTPTPPELIETRAESSPWADRDNDNVKPVRGASPEASEPWNFPLSLDPHDYCYEEIVRTENIDRTVLVVQKKDISSQRQHRLTQVSAAALRHKYAVLEHELRLQKSLSEECEDLGVDSPSAAELFPEAELLFASSPANEHSHEQHHQRHTPQPTILSSGCVQADIDDQIATDQMLHQDEQPLDMSLELEDAGIVTVGEVVPAARTLDHEEFARAHPNTTFHSEPTDEGVIQPYTISSLKARHITFHSSAPATVLMAPQTTVISQATAIASGTVKYADIDNMINSLPETHTNNINIPSVLVKDDGLTRYDNILTDTRELHLSNTASAVIHSVGNGTQVIRRVCYEDNRRERDARYLIDEPDTLIAGNDAKMVAEDCSRDATMESMPGDVDDGNSSPDRNELFWESNSASERSESRRRLDFSSDSDKCCKSPSFDETNSTDSSGVGGAHVRLDSVIKQARAIDRSGSADGSSADDTHPPLRTYPPKRLYHPLESEERSLSGKTRAGERYPDSLEIRRRASGRGVVKRGCHCCNGSPVPPRPKKPRQRKPTMDFNTNN